MTSPDYPNNGVIGFSISLALFSMSKVLDSLPLHEIPVSVKDWMQIIAYLCTIIAGTLTSVNICYTLKNRKK